MRKWINLRAILGASLAVGLLVSLACGSSEEDTPTPSPAPTATATPLILALMDPACDAAQIICETGTGRVVPYWDEEAITAELHALYQQRQCGQPLIQVDEVALSRYDVRNIGRQFSSLLDSLVDGTLKETHHG